MERQEFGADYRPETDVAPVQVEGKTQVGNFDYKNAAVLCYVPICLINLVASLVFVQSEPKENRFVRFHAMQSLVMTIAFMVVGIAVWTVTMVLGVIPIIGWALALVVNLAWLALCGLYLWQSIVGLISANKGEMYHIPYAGQLAEERLAQQ